MLRSGLAIGSGFVLFVAFGRPEAAIVCALFVNLLCLSDKATHVIVRVWVQALGALLFIVLGAIGLLIAGNGLLILVTVFAFALFAGFMHGTTPGVEALPRFGICCMIIAAFLPVGNADTLAGVMVGGAITVVTVVIDDYIRIGRRGPHAKLIRGSVSYPGPRFSAIYACAAVGGLAIGLVWGDIRPYWVTVTTLVVMQPDRRANTVRVIQRFIGTLAGVVMAFAIVRLMPDPMRAQGLTALVLTLPFLWPLGYDRNYALGVAILCTWVLLIIDLEMPSIEAVTQVFLSRLSDTAIGCAVALAGSFAVYEAGADEETG